MAQSAEVIQYERAKTLTSIRSVNICLCNLYQSGILRERGDTLCFVPQHRGGDPKEELVAIEDRTSARFDRET